MCDKAAKDDPSSLQFIPDWFVTQQQIDIWPDDKYWYITMMRLLGGTMVIKNARVRKQILKKNSCPLPGIPIM